MALAHFGLQGREPAEELKSARLAHEAHDPVHPVAVGRLEREAPFPSRIGEALEHRGQLLALDLVRVVAHDPKIGAVAEPAPMGWDRPSRQIGDMGTIELRRHPFARERLDLGRVGLDHVHAAAAAAGLGEGALQHVLAERAPDLDLDAVFLLEG